MHLEQRPNLVQRQTQRLQLTAQMQQSLQVLQMPLEELRDLVQQQLQENPLLETVQPEPEEGATPDPFDNEALLAPEEDTAHDYEDRFETGTVATKTDETFLFALHAANTYRTQEQSYRGLLQEQIMTMGLPARQQQLCLYLIDCLNERGYLDGELTELAQETGVSCFEMEQALFVLQSLEPAGTGARDLSECLLLQLVNSPAFGPQTVKLVKSGLPLLARGDMQGLARLLECTPAQASQAATQVRALNPVPTRGYYTGEDNTNVIPDAMVLRESGEFGVLMNRRAMPMLEINREYCRLLTSSGGATDKQYLKEKRQAAQTLIQSIESRHSTLQKIIWCVVQKQPAFFKGGGALAPMTLKDVAEALELHVSTVSRAVRDKYIVCAAGTVALKTLFSTGIPGAEGAVSATVVRKMIQKCIRDENPQKPLSDENICKELSKMDIDVSRRTVAKYRQEMGYPAASGRRRAKP